VQNFSSALTCVSNDIAQAVAALLEAEQHLEQAKSRRKTIIRRSSQKGWSQAELNILATPMRRRSRKKNDKLTIPTKVQRTHDHGPEFIPK